MEVMVHGYLESNAVQLNDRFCEPAMADP